MSEYVTLLVAHRPLVEPRHVNDLSISMALACKISDYATTNRVSAPTSYLLPATLDS